MCYSRGEKMENIKTLLLNSDISLLPHSLNWATVSRVKHGSVANTGIRNTDSIFQLERDNCFSTWRKGVYRTSNQPWKLLYPEQQYRLKIKKGREGFSYIYRYRICNLLLRKLECLVLRLDKPVDRQLSSACPLVPSPETDSSTDEPSWWWLWLVPLTSHLPHCPVVAFILWPVGWWEGECQAQWAGLHHCLQDACQLGMGQSTG